MSGTYEENRPLIRPAKGGAPSPQGEGFSADEVWGEYEKGIAFKQQLDLAKAAAAMGNYEPLEELMKKMK